ncbi:MAG: penicillin acylase family protein [Betaproteobacteria bacterium]|nr:MAG: penicillin acylase family protein [Betaproteobacteria bacterium]
MVYRTEAHRDMSTSSPASPRRVFSRRLVRYLGGVAVVVLAVFAGTAGWFYVQMRGSLAQLDGEAAMPGATAAIVIERDALGIPTISATSRADVARGLGFLHAQDRFFQMDLARRRAAGELSELFGSAAVPIDTRTRLLRLRARAQRAIEIAAPEERAVLRAYVEGVNEGLSALAVKPPEYLLLRAEPRAWSVEDSALVVASMFLTLQDSEARRESRLAAVYATLPAPLADFITSTASEWETPLVGGMHDVPPIPDARVLDVRAATPAAQPPHSRSSADESATLLTWLSPPANDDAHGSNNWAVAGRLTADGGAIVADDMHLGLSTPNTWYRASMVWRDPRPRRLTGVTLPGVPSLVAGSNGDVAWAFTNSTGDWSDLVILEPDPTDPSRYRTPSGTLPISTVHETINVKGSASVPVEIRETIWGPIVGRDSSGHERAVAWVPLREGGINGTLAAVETAETLEQLFDVAARAGIPAQNVVAAQRDGRIGWSIAGRIPRRVSWADGTHGWDGWLAPAEYPRLVDPPDGRIVTANNRLVDKPALKILGDGGYDPGARARQIKDDLKAISRASVRDMMSVHLDDRAIFLSRWRDLMLQTLSAPDIENSETRRELRRVVSETWTGRASVDSAAYRIVREFRTHVAELAFAPLVERIRQVEADYSPTAARGGEGPLWALVSQRPMHLLDPKFRTWTDLLAAAADRTAEDAQKAGGIAAYAWGRANTVRIKHPLSTAVPMLGPFLDMPTEELPGDSHMPRVQGPTFGASERFAVSPGREQDGYFHMPTGQSGHPLSPHYRDANPAWVAGAPTPVSPQATEAGRSR